jgi:hypothetical protein
MTSRHRTARAALTVAAVALLISACGAAGDIDTPTAPSAPSAPAPTPAPTPVEPPAAEEPEAPMVEVFLVRSGPADFFVEPVRVRLTEAPNGREAHVAVALEALLSIVTPFDPDLFTSVPQGTVLRSVRIDAGTVTIDLGGGVVGSSGASSQEVTFALQLAHTALFDPELTELVVLIEGEPVAELWGHLDWSEPFVVDPFALSPVTITSPVFGAEVTRGELMVAGRATVFEATVLVRVEREDGSVLIEDFVTATEGGPGRGDWNWSVELSTPGLYRIIAGATDPSGGTEGPPPFTTSRTVRVSG